MKKDKSKIIVTQNGNEKVSNLKIYMPNYMMTEEHATTLRQSPELMHNSDV